MEGRGIKRSCVWYKRRQRSCSRELGISVVLLGGATKETQAMAMAEEKAGKEGLELLGSPTFKELENGRFKCVETGHELFAKDMDSYSHSKKCRLGLIDFALSRDKPPLNIFKQDPLSR